MRGEEAVDAGRLPEIGPPNRWGADHGDAARLTREDVFREIVATPEIRSDGIALSGHNPLIGAYSGADGVKTGSTDAAGKVIVGSALRDGHRVYVVVMHSEDQLADSTALFDWAWQEFSWN